MGVGVSGDVDVDVDVDVGWVVGCGYVCLFNCLCFCCRRAFVLNDHLGKSSELRVLPRSAAFSL